MHIPDGFITDPLVWGGCMLATVPFLLYAVRRTRLDFEDRAALLPGLTGAFLFAIQMFNFPVVGGTSGHLLGGVLACTLLGGWAGLLVTSLVLVVQCLLFQDGGVTALGANILNMAILGGGGGYCLFRLGASRLHGTRFQYFSLGLGAGLGVLISAAAAALEIGLSGLISLQTVMVAMLSVHLPIALVEGLATVAVVRSIYQLRPDLVPGLEKTSSWEPVVRALALCSVGVVLLAVPLASSAPDGLESVAARLGFADASVSLLHAPFPEYELPNGSGFFARIGVALLGLLLVLVSSTALVRSLRQRSARVEG